MSEVVDSLQTVTRRRKVRGIVPLCLIIIILTTMFSYCIFEENPLLKRTTVKSDFPRISCVVFEDPRIPSAHWSFSPAPDLTALYSAAVNSCSIFSGAATCLFIWLSQEDREKFLFAPAGFLSASEICDLMCFRSIDFPPIPPLSKGFLFSCCPVLSCCCCCCCVAAVRLACWETMRTGWWSTRCPTSRRLGPWRFLPSTLTHTTGQDLWLLVRAIKENSSCSDISTNVHMYI